MNENTTRLAASIAALLLAACEKSAPDPAGLATSSAAGEPTPGAAGAPAPSAAGELAPGAAGTETGDSVPCLGIHECKGKSACHVAQGHACAGQNACKGKGWIRVPRAECTARGGKILDS